MFGVTFAPTKVSGLGEDQCDPLQSTAAGGLPRAARTRRAGDENGDRGSASRDRVSLWSSLRRRAPIRPPARPSPHPQTPGRPANRLHRADDRQPLAHHLALMDALWPLGSSPNDPGAKTVPTILPGFTDSRHFRAAFPDCVAYGFFPQRNQSLDADPGLDPRPRRANRHARSCLGYGFLPRARARTARVARWLDDGARKLHWCKRSRNGPTSGPAS